jgi:hypothetical protein
MGRHIGTHTYLVLCGELLTELRNSKGLKLSERVLIMSRLSQTYKQLQELHQSSAGIEALSKAIQDIKADLDNKQNLSPRLVEPEEPEETAFNG